MKVVSHHSEPRGTTQHLLPFLFLMHQPYRTETNNAPLSPFKLGVMAADGTIHQISPPPCARRQACKRRGSDAAGCRRGPAGHTACTRVAVSSAAADMKAVAAEVETKAKAEAEAEGHLSQANFSRTRETLKTKERSQPYFSPSFQAFLASLLLLSVCAIV